MNDRPQSIACAGTEGAQECHFTNEPVAVSFNDLSIAWWERICTTLLSVEPSCRNPLFTHILHTFSSFSGEPTMLENA